MTIQMGLGKKKKNDPQSNGGLGHEQITNLSLNYFIEFHKIKIIGY